MITVTTLLNALLAALPENVHALEDMACHNRVAPASSTLAAAPGLLAHEFGHKTVEADHI